MRDTVGAINYAVEELEMHKRMVGDEEVDRAIFLYPICSCDDCASQNGLCDTDRIDFSNLEKCHVSVLASGLLAEADDYLCLLQSSIDSSNMHSVDNANWNPILFAAEAYAFAQTMCPNSPPPTQPPISPPPTQSEVITAHPTWSQPTPNPTTTPPTQSQVVTGHPTSSQPTPSPTHYPVAPPTQHEVITAHPIPSPTMRPHAPPSGAQQFPSARPSWVKPSLTDSPTNAAGRYSPRPIHFDSDDSNGHVDSSSSEWWDSSSSSSSSSDHNGLHWKMGSSSSSSSSSSHNGLHWKMDSSSSSDSDNNNKWWHP
jgi:hypothetical protein